MNKTVQLKSRMNVFNEKPREQMTEPFDPQHLGFSSCSFSEINKNEISRLLDETDPFMNEFKERSKRLEHRYFLLHAGDSNCFRICKSKNLYTEQHINYGSAERMEIKKIDYENIETLKPYLDICSKIFDEKYNIGKVDLCSYVNLDYLKHMGIIDDEGKFIKLNDNMFSIMSFLHDSRKYFNDYFKDKQFVLNVEKKDMEQSQEDTKNEIKANEKTRSFNPSFHEQYHQFDFGIATLEKLGYVFTGDRNPKYSQYMIFYNKNTKKIRIINGDLIGSFDKISKVKAHKYFAENKSFYDYNNDSINKNVDLKDLMHYRSTIFNDFMNLLNYEYCKFTGMDASLLEKFIDSMDMEDTFESIEQFISCVKDFNLDFICDEEYIASLIRENFDLSTDRNQSQKFTEILNQVLEIIRGKVNDDIELSKDFESQVKYKLPGILKGLELKKRRASDGMYWYGIKKKCMRTEIKNYEHLIPNMKIANYFRTGEYTE